MMKKLMLQAWALLCLVLPTYASAGNMAATRTGMQQDVQEEISLREALNRINKTFGVRFTYERAVVDKIKVRYDWDVIKTKTAREVVDAVLSSSGLTYKAIEGNYYIITRPKTAGTADTRGAPQEAVTSALPAALPLKRDTAVNPAPTGRPLAEVSGTISEKGTRRPMQSASVSLVEYGLFTITDAKGAFAFKQVPEGKATLLVQSVSMVSFTKELLLERGKAHYIDAQMEANVLSLKDVEVVAVESKSGPTSSNISRKAIEHLQATSLADVMQLLPGGITVNPDFSNVNRFAIRQVPRSGDVTGNLGTAVIMNGAPVSNNGNLQSLNTSVSGTLASFSTATGGGVDLRTITADNIESIEVIRGIPSVEYGDLTSGAIIVKTKAGAEPFNIKARINPKLTQLWIGKGMSLGNKKGDLNLDLDYTKAMNDQRQNNNSYNRITGNVLYSKKFFTSRPLLTTTGFTYGMNLDNEKQDPDDKRSQKSTKAQNYSFRFNTSGKWNLQRKWARTINYNFTLDYSLQKGYQQELNSGDIYALSFARKDTLAAGQFVPSEYLSKVWIDGKPLNTFSKITNSFFAKTGKLNHRVLMGGEWRMDVNNGKGRTYDLNRPPRQQSGNGFRPRAFSDIPAMHLLSFYLEDNIYTYVAGRKLSLQAGTRLDKVTRAGAALSPRTNLSYEITNNFSIHGGYGITAKAPTLLYLFPDNAYYDLISFNYFSAVPAERLVMISTRVFDTKNNDLRISKNYKKEIGFDWDFLPGKRLTVTAFHERIKNDYQITTNFTSVKMVPFPVLQLQSANPGQPPTLNPVPKQIDTFVANYGAPNNDNLRVNKGIEFDLDLGRFDAIRTSFVFNGAWISSTNTNQGYMIRKKQVNGADPKRIGIFAQGTDERNEENQRLSTTLRLIHNIPEVRFVITFSAQTIWKESSRKIALDSLAVGYIRRDNSQIVWLSKNEREQLSATRQEELINRYNKDLLKAVTWDPLFMFNLRLTKEIGDNIGFSFFANNVFMSRPLEESTRFVGTYERRNQPFFFGTELNIKL